MIVLGGQAKLALVIEGDGGRLLKWVCKSLGKPT
jgi:hypothetical protein